MVGALSRPLSDASDASEEVQTTRRNDPANGPADAQDDARLVLRAREGERAAEELLYRRHAPSVLRLASRLLGSSDDAMDVLQDAFVYAFEELAELRQAGAFRTWLHRITVRLVHRRFRRRRLLRLLGLERQRDELSLDALAVESATPEARAELRWLDEALRRLPDVDRIAWLLRHVEGLAIEEVADACTCSPATAKRRIASADAAVRRHLGTGREEGGR